MLTTKQARENQEKYGFNELVEGKKKSEWHKTILKEENIATLVSEKK